MSVAGPDDLPCAVVVEWVTDYLDDALPPRERDRLEAHLAECDGCEDVVQQFRVTVSLTGRLRDDDVDGLDPTVRDRLLGAFRDWAAERGS